MKTREFPLGLLILSVGAFLLLGARGHAAETHLLPFQGRLSDANGNPVPDGAKVVQFKIYDAPVGGRAVWNGEVQNLTVNGGLVNTLLGTKSDLSIVDFDKSLYLELTIDANDDGQIGPADPPLLPRQSIVPAIFAKEAADSRLLGGYEWSTLFGTNNPADGTIIDAKIADGSLTTSKIRDSAITTAKLANGAVARTKLDVAGAKAGQSLVYNGTSVIWSQVSATNATLATDALHLNGFDWTALFNNGNPESGTMSVAEFTSRGGVRAVGNLTVSGGAIFNGPAVTVLGQLIAPTIGINTFLTDWGLYLRNVGDFNHFLKWGNAWGNQSGFDGPLLVGLGGGVLGSTGDWSLRWNANGTVRTRGSVGQGSDRNIKENFSPVDSKDVLSRVLSLPITRWNYKADPTAPHIGPVSQDFHAAFGLGSDDRYIETVDEGGVALVAIQGLHQKLDDRDKETRQLLAEQQKQIEALRAEIATLKAAQH